MINRGRGIEKIVIHKNRYHNCEISCGKTVVSGELVTFIVISGVAVALVVVVSVVVAALIVCRSRDLLGVGVNTPDGMYAGAAHLGFVGVFVGEW